MSIQVVTNSPSPTERRRGKHKYQKPFQSPLGFSPPELKEGRKSHPSSLFYQSFVSVTFIIVVILPLLLWSGNTNTKEEDRSFNINKSESNHDANGSPEIVWLMSFPNSGTSYTLQYVTTSSNTTVGTNYEPEVKYGKSIPISSKSPDGPFILYDDRKLPSQYILTKTHCSGYCTDCDISAYMLDRFDFQRGCATNKLVNRRDDLMPRNTILYDHNVEPTKIIRLVRDPFSNIASNFHLWLKQQKHLGTGLEKEYADDEKGFMKFCSYYDEMFQKKMTNIDHANLHVKHFLENISNHLEGVPCHQYFVRYIMWHNNANFATKHLPTLTIHYDEYSSAFDETTDKLMNFLKLDKLKNGAKFIDGKSYSNFYTNEQMAAASKLMRHLSQPTTLELISKYLV